MRIVLATNNAGKLRELQALLQAWDVGVVPLSTFTRAAPEESGLTFVENAIIKARYAAILSGLPAIADDSGIEVDALQGRPGIYSARYAGPAAADADNLQKLLDEMKSIPDPQRTARYHCALVYLRSGTDDAPVVCQATWEGRVARAPAGTGGFGYDPLFLLADRELTAAQIDAAEKNRISHRGQALGCLLRALQREGILPPRNS